MALFVGQSVDVGCQACGVGRINSSDMMIDANLDLLSARELRGIPDLTAYLFHRVPWSLLDQLNEIRRA